MSLYNFAKDAARVAKEAGNIDLYSQILEIQEKALELQIENQELKETIKNMNENNVIKEKLIVKPNRYFIQTEDMDEDGPFCTACWDNNEKLIRLHSVTQSYDSTFYECPVCKKSFTED